ncbi:TPA: N-glycosylase/DNA lyase [Candidatus Poribacteria bacterium]|nr:N-glycosylase/DNA lyase [Candidatus Poribacteria bacterium]
MEKNSPDIVQLKQRYEPKKSIIKARLKEFESIMEKGDEAIFEELCFCLFTAGSSARTGLKSIDSIRDILMTGSAEELAEQLKGIHRYGKRRAEYVVLARNFVQQKLGFKLKQTIESFGDNKEALRDFFVRNIKGLGYKEASHFLRNIGFKGYAILDRHILRNLHRWGVTEETASPSSKKKYLEIEANMKDFADEIGVDFDELDFLFWSNETGEILK